MKSIFPNSRIAKLHLGENNDVVPAQSSFIRRKNQQSSTDFMECCNRCFECSDSDLDKNHAIVYIGSESQTLSNVLMTWNKSRCFSYNPDSKVLREEGLKINKTLMKRFYLVERAKDARIVGIVVGTLGVAHYLQVSCRTT